jgi:serine/threonine protein kinase
MTALHPGDQLDHYRIESLVARSGMASIFKGVDTRTGRPVAIKAPHPEMEADPALFDRFRREADIGRKLDHPAVMKVFRDEDRSREYIVMEWVDGRLLRKILAEQGKLPAERAVRIAMGIAGALDYIHKAGVVHRDLKPENIIVGPDDSIKLIDFGIAGQEGARRITFAKITVSVS